VACCDHPTERHHVTDRPFIARQGDVLIRRLDSSPELGKRIPRSRGKGIILAEGEATGHHHRIADPGAELYEAHDPGLEDRFLRVLADGGVQLLHEEHDTITLPPGDYEVRRQREYQPADVPRQVAD
jgi:hypothetical protein